MYFYLFINITQKSPKRMLNRIVAYIFLFSCRLSFLAGWGGGFQRITFANIGEKFKKLGSTGFWQYQKISSALFSYFCKEFNLLSKLIKPFEQTFWYERDQKVYFAFLVQI